MEKNYLFEGPQTEITPHIKEIAERIPGFGLEFVARALLWVHNNVKRREDVNKVKLFRKRTADQIIRDGFSTGCTDDALSFIVLARSKGIPTKYIEAVDNQWLEASDCEGEIRGHIFVECFVNGEWYKVDPAMMLIHAEREYLQHKILGEGLDSWDLGIRSFEDLREKFQQFRSGLEL